ncbi:MAG: glycosyltransferase family 4 protein [Zoogloeaceae bacterium]|nr:glycosyltransferase family 4 protein [Zoogloeaceae bacterium]MCK6382840.1 glycosyltransferase family 4 protein [Rhodocyclaceae bacterium]
MSTRLLFVSKGEDSASTRYRALQFFPLWRAAGFAPAHVTASGGIQATLDMLRQARRADVVVVLRKTFPAPLLWLLRRASRRLVFDFDDAIFCNTDGTPSRTRMARFAAMARACDHVCAGNAFLAGHAAAFNPAVTLVPTCVDVARYRVEAGKPADTLDLVWIGSHSTRKYLAEAMPWLKVAADAVPGLRLKIVADFDLPGCGVATLPVAWRADGEARELAASHIGIAPMRDDDWSRGKCALKVLQYMAAGLPVVSSKAGANAEVIEDGAHGFLAATPAEWAERIAQLAGDAELRRRLGEAGRRRAATDYSVEAVFERLRSAIEGLT